jgi:hypothetical protein
MVIEKLIIRILQTLFVVVVALVISLQHQRIKSSENSIECIQRIIYLNWKLEQYEDLKIPPIPDLDPLPIPPFSPPKNDVDMIFTKQ